MRFSRHPAHAHVGGTIDRKSTRLNSSHGYISYAVFCLKKKKKSNVDHGELVRHIEESDKMKRQHAIYDACAHKSCNAIHAVLELNDTAHTIVCGIDTHG